MPRDIPVPTINRSFVQAALEKGHRLDGRKPLERRRLHIQFPDPEETSVSGLGRVEVSLGKTKVLARVSAELTNPRSDRPFEGLLSITSEIGPLAGEAFHGEGRSVSRIRSSSVLRRSLSKKANSWLRWTINPSHSLFFFHLLFTFALRSRP